MSNNKIPSFSFGTQSVIDPLPGAGFVEPIQENMTYEQLKKEVDKLREELKNTCSLQGAGISHGAFEMVCEERDDAEVESNKLKLIAKSLRQLVRESLEYRDGIYNSEDWNDRARQHLEETK